MHDNRGYTVVAINYIVICYLGLKYSYQSEGSKWTG